MTVGAEQGEIAEVGSPVDIAPVSAEAVVHPLRWTSVTIAVAAALLATVNAAAIGSWQDELPPGPAAERLRPAIVAWQRATDRLHLGVIRESLHDRWTAARAVRFGDEQPGELGAG